MPTNEKYGAHELQRERERISKIKGNAKDVLLDYLNHMARVGKAERTRLRYSLKIRNLHQNVPGGIIPLTEEKVKKAIDWVLAQTIDGHPLALWTITDYQIALKQFWQYSVKTPMPAETAEILRVRKDKNHKLKANDLITQKDLDKLIDSARSSRDKALLAFAFDTGLRHGEILDVRIRDLSFDEYGYQIVVSEEGKTGTRLVRVARTERSKPFLLSWMKEHPRGNEENAFLFCKIERATTGERIGYQDLTRILADITRRAKLGKRIYWHLFRHTRATILSSKIAQKPLTMQMGWTASSAMLEVYSHLDTESQDRSVLEAYGIVKAEGSAIDKGKEPIVCGTCNEPNDYKARFCWRCGLLLDKEESEKAERDDRLIVDSLLAGEFATKTESSLLKNVRDNPRLRSKLLLVMLEGMKENDPDSWEKLTDLVRKNQNK